MDIQRLRNLTTGILHTDIGHVYQDIEYLTGEDGIMTHMLPRACRALQPFLRSQVKENRFWDDTYDVTHQGEFDLRPMDSDEIAVFWGLYKEQPDPLAGKEVIVVHGMPSGTGG